MKFQSLKTSIFRFIQDQWFGVLAFLLGILASCYFYQASLRFRDPIFIVEPARTSILSSGNISNAPIKVIKRNGSEVKSDLTSVRFYFWNRGKEAIKSENILKPLKVYLADTNAEIIDYKILKTSRDIVSPKLEQSSVGATNSLIISFGILEANDGFSGQIIFEGDPRTEMRIDGLIEGVPTIATVDTLAKGKAIKDTFKTSFMFIVALAGGMVAITLFFGLFLLGVYWLINRFLKNLPDNDRQKRADKYLRTALMTLLLMFALGGLILTAANHFSTMDSTARAKISDEVPAWLKR